jgi:hypothetical protein
MSNIGLKIYGVLSLGIFSNLDVSGMNVDLAQHRCGLILESDVLSKKVLVCIDDIMLWLMTETDKIPSTSRR